MTLDVVVVGAPFLDLTFEGLARVPQPGEELVGRALHVAPGGTGMQALGAARLGLAAALVAPIGRAGPAALVRALVEGEGVAVVDGSSEGASAPGDAGVPVTALLPTPGGVAMATVLAGAEPRPEDVAGLATTAVVLSLGRMPLAPRGPALYAVTGGLELDHVAADLPSRLAGARALVLNAAEAAALTGRADPEAAALDLARHVPAAVVTLGAEGAHAADHDGVVRCAAPPIDVVDATGAGDLFVAAYVWADLRGAPMADRIAWASLYASLSVRAPTAFAGAVGLEELLAEGAARELTRPAGLASGPGLSPR